MAREVRFRAWDIKEKRMKLVVQLEWNMDNPSELIEIHTYPVAVYVGGYRLEQNRPHWRPLTNLVLLNPTGLKDKNGVGVFEGDIIDDMIVTYVPSAPDSSEHGMNAGWYLQYNNFHGWTEMEVGSDHSYDGEVIDNIYENPELLKEVA